jgi:hypothetical protein
MCVLISLCDILILLNQSFLLFLVQCLILLNQSFLLFLVKCLGCLYGYLTFCKSHLFALNINRLIYPVLQIPIEILLLTLNFNFCRKKIVLLLTVLKDQCANTCGLFCVSTWIYRNRIMLSIAEMKVAGNEVNKSKVSY